jgi:hypothetical protein
MITNEVFCYYEPMDIFPDSPQLIELWKSSWTRAGWKPTVLGESNARGHPYQRDIEDSPWLQLSVNPWPYMRACYRRWMAYAILGRPWCVHADLDVINFGFTPDDLTIEKPSILHCPDFRGVPCMLHGPSSWYDIVCRTFRNCALMRQAGLFSTRDDLSEMNLYLDYWGDTVVRQNWITDYRSEGWKQARLVHYTHSTIAEPRSPTVRDEMHKRGIL